MGENVSYAQPYYMYLVGMCFAVFGPYWEGSWPMREGINYVTYFPTGKD